MFNRLTLNWAGEKYIVVISKEFVLTRLVSWSIYESKSQSISLQLWHWLLWMYPVFRASTPSFKPLVPTFGYLRFREAVAQFIIWSIFYNIVKFQSCICSLQKSPPTWNMLDVNWTDFFIFCKTLNHMSNASVWGMFLWRKPWVLNLWVITHMWVMTGQLVGN